MHLLSRIGCTCYYFDTMLLEILTRMHSPCFIIHAFAISYAMFMHIGSTEEIMLLEFNEEEKGDQQEIPQATAPEGEEQTPHFLSERQAPEHSKSPSILQNITQVLMIDALGYKS